MVKKYVGMEGTPAFLAIASVQLSRVTPLPGGGVQGTTSMTLHHRFGIDDENVMRGIAFVEAQKAKPGFSVDEILVKIIDLVPKRTTS